MTENDDTVRLDLASLVDPDQDVTAYVERYRPPVPPAPARCIHGRIRIDPCIGCGRRYEAGKLVGPFITTRV